MREKYMIKLFEWSVLNIKKINDVAEKVGYSNYLDGYRYFLFSLYL